MTSYTILAQLAQNFRRMNLMETAKLAEEEGEMLEQQFGPLTEWRISPRTIPPWLDQYVTTLRQHAAHRERLGDLASAVGFLVGVSILAQLVVEGERFTQTAAQGLVHRAQTAVSRAFERIGASKENEARTARCVAERAWQQTRLVALNQQKRDQQVAELSAVKQRLETALGQ